MSKWKVYRNVLIPDIPPNCEPDENLFDIIKMLKRTNCFMARWTSDYDSSKYREFYYVICDEFNNVDKIESKSLRKEIRTGLEKNKIKLIDKKSLIQYGYDVYINAHKNYNTNITSMNKDEFERMVLDLRANIDIWGVYNNKKLVAWSIVEVYTKYCNYKTVKYDPNFLKENVSAALNYTRNEYYLKHQKKEFVLNGTVSLNHDTNVQDYLIKKFNYKKKYCKLNIVYKWYIKFFIIILYPIRNLFYRKKSGIFSKIAVLLRHEEICRIQKLTV